MDLAAPLPGRDAVPHRLDPRFHDAAGAVRSKREADGVPEPLWLIHDAYYDLAPYAAAHPGGREFLDHTRGTDCTEAFELHHVRGVSAKLLDRYRVRALAAGERPLPARHTYAMYGAIKRRVAAHLAELGNPTGTTTTREGLVGVAVLAQYFLALYLMARRRSYAFAALSGFLLAGVWGVGHNRMHAARSGRWAWLRYGVDLTLLLSSHEMTVTHCLSHHVYPNSALDIEVYQQTAARLYWLPFDRARSNPMLRLGLYFVVLPLGMQMEMLLRLFRRVALERDPLKSDVLAPVLTVLAVARVAKSDVPTALRLCWAMVTAMGVTFLVPGQAVHHGVDAEEGAPFAWHEGERGAQSDLAAQQLVATNDHSTDAGSWAAYTLFGGLNCHTVHHLFPTVDLGYHREILRLLLRENTAGFADFYLRRNGNPFGGSRDYATELAPGFVRATMEVDGSVVA